MVMSGTGSGPTQSVDWQARVEADDAPWERPGVHPAIAHWRTQGVISDDHSVYIPGCGRGLEPRAFAELGLAVTATDAAPSAMDFQRQRLRGFSSAAVIETDSLTWRPEDPFDLLYKQTFLCAIHPRQRSAYEQMAYDILKKGGLLLALFMQKEEHGGPPYGCSLSAMRALFDEDRWIWPDLARLTPFPHPGLNGTPELAAALTRR